MIFMYWKINYLYAFGEHLIRVGKEKLVAKLKVLFEDELYTTIV